MARFEVLAGDVLFNATNSPDQVGKSVRVEHLDETMVFSNHFLRLRVDYRRLDSSYLAHWLQWTFERRVFEGMCKQWVNQATVSRDALLNLAIPIPSVMEQRRIASMLDKAASVVRLRERARAVRDALSASVYYAHFGDPVRNESNWAVAPLSAIAQTRLGKMLDKNSQNDGIVRPYLRNANVRWFTFDLSDLLTMRFSEKEVRELALRDGDLLVCEGGEPGRAAVWYGDKRDVLFQKALHRVRPDLEVVLPEFLAWTLLFLSKGGGLKDYVTSATISHLTGEKLRRLPITLPPKRLQDSWADVMKQIEVLNRKSTEAVVQSQALLASLRAQVFLDQS
ncbi:restriction endonuclease subunit S [Kineococcus sp. SYSU DK001]|uniref:restriction endonuclease subunit S n=1 Tax=Kineococcus sp. SYSU DK001 TaxID=3383122 RepID=UPI003D7EA973